MLTQLGDRRPDGRLTAARRSPRWSARRHADAVRPAVCSTARCRAWTARCSPSAPATARALADTTLIMLTRPAPTTRARCRALGVAALPAQAGRAATCSTRSLDAGRRRDRERRRGRRRAGRSRPTQRAARAILLVEDNAINQTLACALLAKAGHVVTVAENGQEARRRVCGASLSTSCSWTCRCR